MAVAYVAGQTGKNTSTTTSIPTINISGTGASIVVIGICTRLGCTSTDVTGLSVQLNGSTTGQTFAVGSADTSIFGGDCGHARVVYFLNPTSGTNTVDISWTSSAWGAAVVYTLSGAGSVGTVVEQTKSTADYSVSATITADDMVIGYGIFSDNVTQLAISTGSNYLEDGDAGGNIAASGATNTGSGSVTVAGTCRAFGHSAFAVPIIASGGAVTPDQVHSNLLRLGVG
jgi:hypothetical protein